MKRNWMSKFKEIETDKSYEEKMHDAFMAHMGKCYAEQLFKENAENMEDIHAPKSLDDWFAEFCKEKWGTKDVAVGTDCEEEEEKTGIVEQETTEKLAVGQNQENDEKYGRLLMYTEHVRLKLKKQQERQKRARKVIAFVVLLLGVVAITTGTAKAFGINPWKLFIKDEGTDVVIRPSDFGDERNYYLSSDWIGYYYPAYVPEGYELKKETVQEITGELLFVGEANEILFYCAYCEIPVALDKEQEDYEVIQVEDQTGYLVLNKEQAVACVYLDRYTILIFYNNEPVEKIYEMIKKIKKFE